MPGDRLLNKAEIANIFNVSPKQAIAILIKENVSPIDLGRGRGKGLRWPESIVLAIVKTLYDRAQPKPQTTKKPSKDFGSMVATSPIKQLHCNLTQRTALQ